MALMLNSFYIINWDDEINGSKNVRICVKLSYTFKIFAKLTQLPTYSMAPCTSSFHF